MVEQIKYLGTNPKSVGRQNNLGADGPVEGGKNSRGSSRGSRGSRGSKGRHIDHA